MVLATVIPDGPVLAANNHSVQEAGTVTDTEYVMERTTILLFAYLVMQAIMVMIAVRDATMGQLLMGKTVNSVSAIVVLLVYTATKSVIYMVNA